MLFCQLFGEADWTYTYLIADFSIKEAILVDPMAKHVERDLRILKELGLTLRYCLATHIRTDHVTAIGKLGKATGCLSIVLASAQATWVDRFMQDGEVLQIGDVRIEAIATVEHIDRCMAYLVNGTHLLTRDSLFEVAGVPTFKVATQVRRARNFTILELIA